MRYYYNLVFVVTNIARVPAKVRARVHVPLHGPEPGEYAQQEPVAVAALRLRLHLRQVSAPLLRL